MLLQKGQDFMKHSEKATELFAKGYNCSQAVFAAFCDETGMDEETALKISSSFGGGMGRMREVCGAVSGMFMVAGMLYGYSDTEAKSKGEHYELIQKMAEKFKEKNHGTIICRELLQGIKTDAKPTPSERNEHYYKVRPCVKFVMDASDILDELIAEKNK